ncbi:MAG: hypothetical protein HC836_23650 [Richelia sp. RM2_1_2]|nr:hypothetical protein [Richelia sp. RM2_1_2]
MAIAVRGKLFGLLKFALDVYTPLGVRRRIWVCIKMSACFRWLRLVKVILDTP